jgi:hypothetical protein
MNEVVVLRFKATSRDGIHTLDCELVEGDTAIHLEYVIVALFVSRGERRRQSWGWCRDYPRWKLWQEATEAAHKIACAMWGEQP